MFTLIVPNSINMRLDKYLSENLDQLSRSKIQNLINDGKVTINGEKEKSVKTFEEAIKQENDKIIKANLYFNLGVLYMQLDQFEDAEDNFFSAYDLNPEDTEALSGIAQTFENAEKWRRASKFYRELIELDPENPDHYKGMARVLIKQGDMDGATKYFEKAKKLGG